jgi:hypothetical protein
MTQWHLHMQDGLSECLALLLELVEHSCFPFFTNTFEEVLATDDNPVSTQLNICDGKLWKLNSLYTSQVS